MKCGPGSDKPVESICKISALNRKCLWCLLHDDLTVNLCACVGWSTAPKRQCALCSVGCSLSLSVCTCLSSVVKVFSVCVLCMYSMHMQVHTMHAEWHTHTHTHTHTQVDCVLWQKPLCSSSVTMLKPPQVPQGSHYQIIPTDTLTTA